MTTLYEDDTVLVLQLRDGYACDIAVASADRLQRAWRASAIASLPETLRRASGRLRTLEDVHAWLGEDFADEAGGLIAAAVQVPPEAPGSLSLYRLAEARAIREVAAQLDLPPEHVERVGRQVSAYLVGYWLLGTEPEAWYSED